MIRTSRLPIVLCCAEESEAALVAVVDVLHREGHAPEIVPGVEADTGLLTAAVDRVRGPALFVLCGSDGLDRAQVRRLEGLFSARRGPDHHMIAIEVARRSTAAIVSVVRSATRDVGRRRSDDDDGSAMRDVVIPTSVVAVPGASPTARAAASRGRTASKPAATVAQAPDGISEEALGLPSGAGETDTEVFDPDDMRGVRQRAEPDVKLATTPAARAALQAAGFDADPGPSDGVPLAVPEDFPMVGESGQDVEIRGAPGRVGWDHSGPVEVERVARPTRVDPRAESDHTPLPSASSPIEIGRPAPLPAVEPAPPARRGGARWVLLLLAGAGLGAVVTMALLHATAPVLTRPEDVHERGIPRASAREAGPEGDVAKPHEPDRSAEAHPSVDASTGSGEPPHAETTGHAADVTTGSVAERDAGAADDASTGSDAASDASGTTSAAHPSEGAGPKLVPPPPSRATEGDGSLAAAIAEGRVREAGPLLLVDTGPSTVTWDEAVSRCRRRKLGGVGGWRLPGKGQLVELRRAKLLGPGSYWSRSTVGEDEAFVVDAASGEASQWLKIEPNGRVACVRTRPQ